MAVVRVWLHQGEGDERGWSAWSLDHLGFATWAPTREEALARVPAKLAEYGAWLARYGEPWDAAQQGPLEVVEEIAGNEVAFRDDLLPASVAEIERCERLLRYTRADLLQTVASLPDAVFDWDPPYRRFAPHAWWRTIRQILQHIALTDVGYYLPSIGWQTELDLPALRAGSWLDLLQRSREETLRFLEELKADPDKVRLEQGEETWSVRKVLRRLVWHERLHWKSIQRILADYAKSSQQNTATGASSWVPSSS